MIGKNGPRGGCSNNHAHAAVFRSHHHDTSELSRLLLAGSKLATDKAEVELHWTSERSDRFLVLSYHARGDRVLTCPALEQVLELWREYVLARGWAMHGARSLMRGGHGEFDLLNVGLAWFDFAIPAAGVILSPENHQDVKLHPDPLDPDAWFFGFYRASKILMDEEDLRASIEDRAQTRGGQDAYSTS